MVHKTSQNINHRGAAQSQALDKISINIIILKGCNDLYTHCMQKILEKAVSTILPNEQFQHQIPNTCNSITD